MQEFDFDFLRTWLSSYRDLAAEWGTSGRSESTSLLLDRRDEVLLEELRDTEQRLTYGRRPAYVQGIATAYPPHRLNQEEAHEIAQRILPRWAARESMAGVFTNASIQGRSIVRPVEWYKSARSVEEKARVYRTEARSLAARAARDAIHQAQCSADEIDAVLVVSTTGFVTPSLAVGVALDLGLSPHVAQVPLVGYGCAGGALGLARALEAVRAGYRRVLLVAVELCSSTLLHSDDTSSNYVALALFADGAAALVVSSDGDGPSIVEAHNTLLHDTEHVMGWENVADGLKVVFGVEIPPLARDQVPPTVEAALRHFRWTWKDVQHVLVHPGGRKVLEALESVLSPLPIEGLEDSWAVLREQGNISSVTVLAVLERAIQHGRTGRTLLSAMGPGFNICHVGVIL